MINKIIRLIHKEIAGIHQAAYILGIFAVSSQLLGLLRDRILANLFGAGQTLDTYYAAFRIPDIIFLTIASIVSISVLIPFFIDRVEKGYQQAKDFLDSVFSLFFVVIILVCGIAFFIMPFLVPLVFPGFSESVVETTTSLSRLLLLSPILLGLSNLFATVTQAYQRFLLHALSPLVYNLGIIFGAVVLVPHFGIHGVVYGVIGGSVMHLLIQVPFIVSKGFIPKLKFNWIAKPMVSVIIHSSPRRIALSVHHIAIVFLLSIASLIAEGSISIFQFSFNLQSVSLSVIGVSYSVAAFPVLTRLFSRGDMKQFSDRVLTTARHIIFWSIPLTVLFIVLRAQIVRTVLGSGRFDWDDTRLTAAALALFICSLVFQGLMLLFVRGYYAIGNTKTPFFINIFSGIVMIASALGLWFLFESSPAFQVFIEKLLRVEGLNGTGVLMLPLGYTIGFFVNGLLLWRAFERDFRFTLKPLLTPLWHSSAGSVLAGFVSYGMLNVLAGLLNTQTLVGIFLQGFIAGMVGILAMVGLLVLTGSRELRELWIAFRKKVIRPHQVVAGDSETLENS